MYSVVVHSGRKKTVHPNKDHAKKTGAAKISEKSPSLESIFNREYTVRVEKTGDIGAFVIAPREVASWRRMGRFSGSSEAISVLLPFSEQTKIISKGMNIDVHFYEDKGGRLACTMRKPILKDGETGILKVADSTDIGVFLDNGLPKQLLLPFREQISHPKQGDDVLVWLYTDKSGRPAATMRVYGHLSTQSPYVRDSRVRAFVYEINPKMGLFVAVDDKYYGLVPISEVFGQFSYGDIIDARVIKVREDGKLDLSLRGKLYETRQKDALLILEELKKHSGFLPYGDRTDPEFILKTYKMSKNQFKCALGYLYKNHIVRLDRENNTVSLV